MADRCKHQNRRDISVTGGSKADQFAVSPAVRGHQPPTHPCNLLTAHQSVHSANRQSTHPLIHSSLRLGAIWQNKQVICEKVTDKKGFGMNTNSSSDLAREGLLDARTNIASEEGNQFRAGICRKIFRSSES